jgi:hypothetical protein
MRRAMTLMGVMGILLFSHLALAEVEFQVGETALTRIGEVQPQGVAAGGFQVVPLQAVVMDAGGLPTPWWHLDQDYYLSAQFTVYGTGPFKARVKVTDVKTGQFITFPKTAYEQSDGNYSIQTTLSASGDAGKLPRQFKLTYEFKVGTTWKSVSTKFLLY